MDGTHRKGFVLTLSTVLSFFGASLLLAAAPGPDVIFVLTQSLSYGRKAGMWVVLGNVAGVTFHIAAVALGLGALIANSPPTYNAIKYVGACYLLFLAYKTFQNKDAPDLDSSAQSAVSELKFFVQGATVSILNPHVTVLFIAFLPQFVDVRRGQVPLQFVSLGVLFMIAALIVFSSVAISSSFVREKIERSPSIFMYINRAACAVFVVFAIRLFLG